ncbi:hypothetical protein chiPu_0033467, partial [Chiloscyllium punctatum]|nr:hypothetical protein [Chiloscyllium punctatum]
ARQGERRRHLVERRIERASTLAQRDDGGRQLVDGDGRDRRDLGQPGPDIGQHDDDERRQIEQQDQPGIAKAIGERDAAHQVADRRAERHRQREGQRDAGQRCAEVDEQRARSGLGNEHRQHRRRCRQLRIADHERGNPPGRDEQRE